MSDHMSQSLDDFAASILEDSIIDAMRLLKFANGCMTMGSLIAMKRNFSFSQ